MQFTEEALFAVIGRQALVIEHLNRTAAALQAELAQAREAIQASKCSHPDAAAAPAGEGV